MISPASVMLLYRSKMVVGRGKIYPLMCGVFCLGVFPFRHPRFFPQMSSAPLTSSWFSGQFIICTLSSTIFTRCVRIGKAILCCSFRSSRFLVYSRSEYLEVLNSTVLTKHRFPCGHIGVEETPFALCEGSDFSPWQVDNELVFSGAVVGHPYLSATFERDRMLTMPPVCNHTVPCPGRSPWRSVVVYPLVEKIASDLSNFLMFFRRRLFENTSTVDWMSSRTQVGLMCPPDWPNVTWQNIRPP